MRTIPSYFERINYNSRPHPIHNKSWESYSPLDFTDAFLPFASSLIDEGISLFDGAELFTKVWVTKKGLLSLSENEKPIELIFYTFPHGTLASQNKQRIQLYENELCGFAEIDENNKITVSFMAGAIALKQINSYLQSTNQLSVDASLDTLSRTLSLDGFDSFFQQELSQVKCLQFLFALDGEPPAVFSMEDSYKYLDAILKELAKGFMFDAGSVRDRNAQAWGHGDIEEKALKAKGFSVDQIQKIYFGNWLRDYSSVITAMSLGFKAGDIDTLRFKEPFESNTVVDEMLKSINTKFTHDGWIKIINILATKEFVYNKKQNPTENYLDHKAEFKQRFGTITKDRLGVYLPHEHIDNPKYLKNERILGNDLLSDPVKFQYEYQKGKYVTRKLYAGETAQSLEINWDTRMKRYIREDVPLENDGDISNDLRPSSVTFFSEQLRLAAVYKKTQAGYRHLGAAFHVLEDYFAHSNFVELVLIKNGATKVNPWVQVSKETAAITNGAKKIANIPVVTGMFGFDDLLASLVPKMADEFFPTSIQDYKSLKKGDVTFFDALFITIMNDFIDKEAGLKSKNKSKVLGFTYEEILKMYYNFLSYREMWLSLKSTDYIGPVIETIDWITHYVGQGLKFFPSLLMNMLLKSLSHETKNRQSTNYGTNPSHTQLAKDSDDHPLNPLAGYLAFLAVGKMTEMMKSCWYGKIDVEQIIDYAKKHYFVHPLEKDAKWADAHVVKWKNANRDAVKKAESTISTYKKPISIKEKKIDLSEEELRELLKKPQDKKEDRPKYRARF